MRKLIDVLLVDSDQQRFQQIKSTIEDCYAFIATLEWVWDVEEALPRMVENQHDIYLLADRGIETGMELLKRSVDQGCHGPVILLGNGTEESNSVAALEAGAVEYLIETGLNAAILTNCIQTALMRKQLQDTVRETQKLWIEHHEQKQLTLSRRLHEGPLQDLIGMRLYLGFAMDSVDNEEAKRHLAFVQQTLQNVIDSLRSFCVELRPPALDPFGLEKAIRAEARRFQQQHPEIALFLDLETDDLHLPEQLRIGLYRIFQQGLNNIAEHAQATQVRIQFYMEGSTAYLQIDDDGCGFSPPDSWLEFARDHRFGLFEASQQARHMGGLLQVESHPDPAQNEKRGTTIMATVPIH